MLRYGTAPFLECSSRGDKRFSAFVARIKIRENRTIEELYQAFKIFSDGSSNLSWRDAKGRKPVNMDECRQYYTALWDMYITENPELLEVIAQASGLSDMFGQEGHVCQAEELWRIRNTWITNASR